MDGFGHTPPGTRLFELANAQFGVLRLDQLLAAGLTPDAIDSWVARHRLTRVHSGVFAFGHTALRNQGLWLAALWASDGCVLSHVSASDYFGWTALDRAAPVHLSSGTAHKTRSGLVIHRVKPLARVDVHVAHPFRVTTIPRTLVDLADVLPWPAYRALADAQPRLYPAKIREAQQRAGQRIGRGRVTRLIDADDAHTESEFERRFLRYLGRQALPRPDVLNARVAGHKADCVYRAARLVVELEGRAFHQRRAQMRADRHRDTDYQLAGHRILRLVWDDLHADEAARTAERLRRLLALGAP